MKEKFTRELYELYTKQNIGLAECLRIISHKPGRKKDFVKKTAEYLHKSLEDGNFLSNAMKTCPYFDFDDIYISFIRIAEKTGKFKETISYLMKKIERQDESRNKVFGAIIYPIFVVVISVVACVFVCAYLKRGSIADVFCYVAILSGACILMFLMIVKFIGENKTYEAFLAADFLVKAGCGISAAVECAAGIVGNNTETGRIFKAAKEKLEYGFDLKRAFCTDGKFSDAFYYADISGNQTDVFEKIAIYLNQKDEKKRKVCLILIEPVFILVTGVFLFSLILKFMVPYLTDFNWV